MPGFSYLCFLKFKEREDIINDHSAGKTLCGEDVMIGSRRGYLIFSLKQIKSLKKF